MTRPILLCALAVLAAGCPKAMVGLHSSIEVPADARKTCEAHCKGVGMTLSAMAIMANNVGCVCRDVDSPADGAAGTAAGGVTTIMLQQQAAAAAQAAAQQQQQQQQPLYKP